MVVVAACGAGASDTATPIDTGDASETAIEEPSVSESPEVDRAVPPTSSTSAASTTRAPAIDCQPAPPDTGVVLTGPTWQNGVQRELEVQIRKSTSPSAASLTPVTLTVLETVGSGGARFEWVSSQTALNGVPARPDLEDLLEGAPKERIVYSVDDDRYFRAVENVDELRTAYGETFDLLVDAGMSEAEVTAGREFLDGLSDDGVSQIFSERPMIYHALEGFELEVGQSRSGDDVLPNVFGGEPFPAVSTVGITNLVDDDGCVEVTMTVVVVPDEFIRILSESLDLAGPPPDESDATIENTVIAQYDLHTGLLRSVSATQFIRIDGQERIDETTIRDVTS